MSMTISRGEFFCEHCNKPLPKLTDQIDRLLVFSDIENDRLKTENESLRKSAIDIAFSAQDPIQLDNDMTKLELYAAHEKIGVLKAQVEKLTKDNAAMERVLECHKIQMSNFINNRNL